MKKIIYTRSDDGGVNVVSPYPPARLAFGDGEFGYDRPYALEEIVLRLGALPPVLEIESDDAFVARVAALSVPADAIDVRVIDEADLPTDRTFRGAWEHRDGRISTNMTKAREIHKRRLRAARAPLLADLDVAYQRADEADDKSSKRAIATRKQAPRDVTSDPAIAAAQTPDELAAVWPAALQA